MWIKGICYQKIETAKRVKLRKLKLLGHVGMQNRRQMNLKSVKYLQIIHRLGSFSFISIIKYTNGNTKYMVWMSVFKDIFTILNGNIIEYICIIVTARGFLPSLMSCQGRKTCQSNEMHFCNWLYAWISFFLIFKARKVCFACW